MIKADELIAVGIFLAIASTAYGTMAYLDWQHRKRTGYVPPDAHPISRADDRRYALEDILEKAKRSNLPDEVTNRSIANWQRIPRRRRERCLAHLWSTLRSTGGVPVLKKWQQQKREGLRVGSDEPCFHFGHGMWVRNALRQIMRDDELPPVDYDGQPMRNWDDFYYGALDELAGRTWPGQGKSE